MGCGKNRDVWFFRQRNVGLDGDVRYPMLQTRQKQPTAAIDLRFHGSSGYIWYCLNCTDPRRRLGYVNHGNPHPVSVIHPGHTERLSGRRAHSDYYLAPEDF